jgi:FtsH-binding integral membrane protein
MKTFKGKTLFFMNYLILIAYLFVHVQVLSKSNIWIRNVFKFISAFCYIAAVVLGGVTILKRKPQQKWIKLYWIIFIIYTVLIGVVSVVVVIIAERGTKAQISAQPIVKIFAITIFPFLVFGVLISKKTRQKYFLRRIENEV